MEILPTYVVRINGQAEKKLIENVSLLQQPITMYSQVSVGEINPIVDDQGLPTDMTLNQAAAAKEKKLRWNCPIVVSYAHHIGVETIPKLYKIRMILSDFKKLTLLKKCRAQIKTIFSRYVST